MAYMRKYLRRRMDERYSRLSPLSQMGCPNGGWIRAVRDALGMSGAELARRMGVSQQRIATLERGEMELTVQLNTLQRVADALDCELVYALVPRTSLTEMVKAQARLKAVQHHSWVAHHSRLEDQESDDRLNDQIEDLVGEFENRRDLWSDSPRR